jgi:hypothetical protein
MCVTVRLNGKRLSSPRELREEIGILVWQEGYTECATHDVWLDSCLCSIDIPASLVRAGLKGNWQGTGSRREFVVEAHGSSYPETGSPGNRNPKRSTSSAPAASRDRSVAWTVWLRAWAAQPLGGRHRRG